MPEDRKLTAASPLEDAAEGRRQHEYLSRAKLHVKELAQVLHRTPTCCVVTFGCQMNARDSEKLTGILSEAGFVPCEEESADLVVYNTCTVRDNADNHFFGRLGRASHYKKSNPFMRIAVCGCMAQEAGARERLEKSYPYVDLVFGTHNLFRFAEYLCGLYEDEKGGFAAKSRKNRRRTEIWEKAESIVEDLPVERKYPYKSGVNISFGCNNFCTYCIVPYVRGRERSRDAGEILAEIRRLADDGVVEIMLLGQNVNSYGHDLENGKRFSELLDAAAHVPGIRRVRFMTPHPKDFSEDVLDVIEANPNIARHIHLPLQSGSTRILQKMNRRYTKEQYLDLALHIRDRLPDVAITTDIIVGFPYEEERDIEDTLDVIDRVCYDNAYTFIYSRRRGTPAASMPQVDPEVVKTGFDRVLASVQEHARKRTALLGGAVMTGLCEEVNAQNPALMTFRLSNNTLVHCPGSEEMIGRFFRVSLDTCQGFYYFGSVLEEV